MIFFRKALIFLTYLLPAVLFFSFYPILKLGQNSSMNFELSLSLIWLVLFDFFALINLLALRFTTLSSTSRHLSRTRLGLNFPGISDRRIFLVSLFPFFATISIFWSTNPTRALLTAGILWLVLFAAFSCLYLLPLLHPSKTFSRNLLISFFSSTLIVCIFCWLQSILDLLGVAREHTLLCLGCTYHSFGFPHPSGFAIEPQFMGNLLLAPTLLSLYFLIFRRPSHSPDSRLLTFLAIIFSATLFLTFSRGAIYAYIVALLALFIFAWRQLKRKSQAFSVARFLVFLIPIFTFVSVLIIQGTFAALGPTSETFLSGITKSIHQLSLGAIDLRSLAASDDVSSMTPTSDELSSASSEDPATDKTSNPSDHVDNNLDTDTTEESAIFEGYVPESTNVRLSLNSAAIETWLSAPGHPESSLEVGLRCHFFLPGTGPACTAFAPLTPTSVLFGVGLGGAGTALYRNSSITNITSPKEIVQNQFFSLLLELGAVGIVLLLIAIWCLFSPRSGFWYNPMLPFFVALLLAYFATLNFFSGLPNALQIYLLPPLLYLWSKLTFPQLSPKNSKKSQKS